MFKKRGMEELLMTLLNVSFDLGAEPMDSSGACSALYKMKGACMNVVTREVL